MSKIYNGMIELIGNTPLVEASNIERIRKLEAKILMKLEYFNPSGSVKDRIALSMLEDAEERGILKKDTVIIEPTSGNTGIGLAAIAAAKGYHVILTMPNNVTKERRNMLYAYGAEIILTGNSRGIKGAIEKAEELAKEYKNSYVVGQFDNLANPEAHRKTTGPEIWNDTDGKVDILVAGVGSGGTITGVGEFLKSKNPDIKVIAVEPATSAVLSGNKSGYHRIHGIGAGFIPKILNKDIYDEIIQVSNDEAYAGSRIIAKHEGLLVGISSGAAFHAAVEVAKRSDSKGKTIVVILPDSGNRYYSTALFSNFS